MKSSAISKRRSSTSESNLPCESTWTGKVVLRVKNLLLKFQKINKKITQLISRKNLRD
jgi:hypothetical protein